jgi:hypothetical protein
VGKLFKLMEWLTLADAAQHLSIMFGEDVREADVLRLALDGHLKLSAHMVNHARALRGKVVPIDEAETVEMFEDLSRGKSIKVIRGLHIREGEILELDKEIVTLVGVWDLPMIGAERLDVEHEYQNQTGGPDVTLLGLDGAFVEGQDGTLFQLQESYDENEYQTGSNAHLRKLNERIARDNVGPSKAQELLDQYKKNRKTFLAESKANEDSGKDALNYYPAGGLPKDGVLVVRTDALRKLEQSIIGAPASVDKPMTTTERNTLLTIIAALCDYSAIKPGDRGAASQIAKLTEDIAATVTDDTIRKVLAKIPDALEARMK